RAAGHFRPVVPGKLRSIWASPPGASRSRARRAGADALPARASRAHQLCHGRMRCAQRRGEPGPARGTPDRAVRRACAGHQQAQERRPGMAATTFYTTVAPAFARIHRDRDIVLVDQRGTGRSNALNCELSDDFVTQETDAQIVAEAARCLKDTSAHADVAYYTTSVAVQDLDTVRAALGYDRINLYGGSYGTRVAQHYLRRFPTHTRTVILDGVVPPTLALGPAVAVDAQNALLRILARCTREPQCQSRFGDPVADYHKLSAQMRIQPVPITIADPTTGEQSKLELSTLQLATVLRLTTYTPQEAALLPLILHRASESGDFMPLATQYLLISRSLGDQLSYGMHNSVVCAEDVPFYNEKTIDRKLLEQTYLGTSAVDGLRDICQVWPRGPIDKDFHEPLHSDVPALLLGKRRPCNTRGRCPGGAVWIHARPACR